MIDKKSSINKVKKAQKQIAPEVLEPKDKTPAQFVMDGTAVTEFSIMQNIDYASEIIQGAREAFNLNKLNHEKKKGTDYLLREGERQIFKLWHSVVALDTHNTLFVTLFLIAIGEVLNEIKMTLKPHEFSKWRRKVFHYKHERYLQQAQQLASMGLFARKYAAMGKKRLLALDHLKNTKKAADCKELLRENPLPKHVEENLPTYKELRKNPFPDLTEDLEGDLLKEHVDALVTLDRLKETGVQFATFDHAQLIVALNKDAITKNKSLEIKALLDKKRKISDKEKLFNKLLLNKMIISDDRPRKEKAKDSLNQILANFILFSKSADLENEEWIKSQQAQLEQELLVETFQFLIVLSEKLGIDLSKVSGKN